MIHEHIPAVLLAVYNRIIVASTSSDYMLDCYTNNPRSMHTCAFGDMAGAFGGQGVFGLTVAGLVFFGGYTVGDGDIILPGVVLMLLGGILIPSLPPQYEGLALTLMFAGAVGAVMQLLGKYVFGPSVN